MPSGLIGAWRLVSLEEQGRRVDCGGLLVFTADGHMSVQISYRDAQPDAPPGGVQYAKGDYEASFGTYDVDEAAHVFTFRVEGALVRTLVGRQLRRVFELSSRQLILTPANPTEDWKLVWER